jgi:hypothetical protein
MIIPNAERWDGFDLCTIYTQTIAYLGLIDQKDVFFIDLFAFMIRRGDFDPNL